MKFAKLDLFPIILFILLFTLVPLFISADVLNDFLYVILPLVCFGISAIYYGLNGKNYFIIGLPLILFFITIFTYFQGNSVLFSYTIIYTLFAGLGFIVGRLLYQVVLRQIRRRK